ncbi:hypothetical protein D3C75_1105660 [compost metagenome]
MVAVKLVSFVPPLPSFAVTVIVVVPAFNGATVRVLPLTDTVATPVSEETAEKESESPS